MVNNHSYQQAIVSTQNLGTLKNIAIEKYKSDSSATDITRVEELVYLAAVSVLKDVQPYLEGNKKINLSQIQQIKQSYDKIQSTITEAVKTRDKGFATKGHMLMSMISRLREHSIDPQNPETFQKVMDGYIQIMGCVTAYGNWQKGDVILGPHAELPNYEVHDVIQNENGLQVVVLTPIDKSPDGFPPMPPILCCRGTVPSDTHNLIDDLNEHIGQYSFQLSKTQIRETLQDIAHLHGPAVLTGHSLGGAIAQAITEECCDQSTDLGKPVLQSVYHYNAPGVGDKVAARFDQKLKGLPVDRHPKVISYHHKSDIVALAGGDHLKASIRHEVGETTRDFIAAHSFKKLIFDIGSKIVNTKIPLTRRIARSFTEGMRRMIAKIGLLNHFLTDALAQKMTQIKVQNLAKFTRTPSFDRHDMIAKENESRNI